MIRTQAHGSVVIDQLDAAIDLHVEGGDFFGTGRSPSTHEGLCLVEGDWRLDAETTFEAGEPIPLEATVTKSSQPVS
jgi:hypothetical protein